MHIMFKQAQPTLAELAPLFKAFLKASDCAQTTVTSYCSDFSHFLNWVHLVLPNCRLSEIDAFTVQRYRALLDRTEKRSTSTTNRRLQSLRKFFFWAVREGLTTINIAQEVKLKPQAKLLRPKSLSAPELHKVLTLSGRGSLGTRNYCLVQLMLQTGLRIGEVWNLTLQDVTLYERSGQVRVQDGKGRKERFVPLNASARKAIGDWLLKHPKKDESVSKLFLSANGKPLQKRALQKIIEEIMGRAGCEGSAHTLRHTFATRHYQDNGKLVELGALLGHESLNTTARYTQASQEDLAKMLEQGSLNEFGS